MSGSEFFGQKTGHSERLHAGPGCSIGLRRLENLELFEREEGAGALEEAFEEVAKYCKEDIMVRRTISP